MIDPYARSGPNDPIHPANDAFLITPDDNDALAKGLKVLRIFNPTNAVAHVAVVTLAGTTVSIGVLANSLTFEKLRVSKVLATGTSAGLELHGYTDSAMPVGGSS